MKARFVKRLFSIFGLALAMVFAVSTVVACTENTPQDTRELASISITTAPTKTTYKVGEVFDPTGMVVTATFADETKEEVTDYTFKPDGALTMDDKSVTVSYTVGRVTKSAYQNITVNPAGELTSIEITKQPNKVDYVTGEKFSILGMEVTAHYSDGSSRVVRTFTWSPSEGLGANDDKVTISYTEGDITMTTDVKITVSVAELVGLKISGSPKKLTYKRGEAFDPTGLNVTAEYINVTGATSNVNVDINKCVVTPEVINSVNDTQVKISYTDDNGLTAVGYWKASNQAHILIDVPEVDDSKNDIGAVYMVSDMVNNENVTIDEKITLGTWNGSYSRLQTGAASPDGIVIKYDYSAYEGDLGKAAFGFMTNASRGAGIVQVSADGETWTTISRVGAGMNMMNADYKYLAKDANGKSLDSNSNVYWAYWFVGEYLTESKTIYVRVGYDATALTENEATVWDKNGAEIIDRVTFYNVLDLDASAHEKKLTGISVKEGTEVKTSYTEGEYFDATNVVLIASWDDGTTTEVTTGYTYAPTGKLTTADEQITFTYQGQTTTLAIYVSERTGSLESLTIKSYPNRLYYTEGEEFDATGLVVLATYTDGSTEVLGLADLTVSGGVINSNNKKFTVTYGTESVEITVHVRRTDEPSGLEAVVADTLDFSDPNNYTATGGASEKGSKPTNVPGLNATRLRANGDGGYIMFEYTFEDDVVLAQTGFMVYASRVRRATVIQVSTDGENWQTILQVADRDKNMDVYGHYSVFSEYIPDAPNNNIWAFYFALGDYIGESRTVYVRLGQENSAGYPSGLNEGADIFGHITFYSTLILDADAEPIELTGLTLKDDSTVRKNYTEGESFDPTGLVLEATWSTGTKTEVKSGFKVTPAGALEVGTTEVVVSYNGMSVTITGITVEKRVAQLTGLEIAAQPEKLVYTVGSTFNTAGMKVLAVFDDESTLDVTDQITFSPDGALTLEVTEITISFTFNGVTKTATIEITVREAVLTGITVSGEPAKREYQWGEDFDPNGLTVTAHYEGAEDKTIALEECDIWPKSFKEFSDVNWTYVKVSYTENGVTQEAIQCGSDTHKIRILAPEVNEYVNDIASIINFADLREGGNEDIVKSGSGLQAKWGGGFERLRVNNASQEIIFKHDYSDLADKSNAAFRVMMTTSRGAAFKLSVSTDGQQTWQTVAQAGLGMSINTMAADYKYPCGTVYGKDASDGANKNCYMHFYYLGEYLTAEGADSTIYVRFSYDNSLKDNWKGTDGAGPDIFENVIFFNDFSIERSISGLTVTGLEIQSSESVKTEYTAGEKFDATGLVLNVVWSDESTTIAKSGFTWTPNGALTVADTTITISYLGKTVELAITVAPATVEVVSIAVTKNPNRMYYYTYLGNASHDPDDTTKFDPTGMVVTATYDDNSTAVIDNAELTFENDVFSLTNKTVTIKYEGVSTTLTVGYRENALTEWDMTVADEIYLPENATADPEHFEITGFSKHSGTRKFTDRAENTDAYRWQLDKTGTMIIKYTFAEGTDLTNAGVMFYMFQHKTGGLIEISTDEGANWVDFFKFTAGQNRMRADYKAPNNVIANNGNYDLPNFQIMYYSLGAFMGESRTVWLKLSYSKFAGSTPSGAEDNAFTLFGSVTFFSKLMLDESLEKVTLSKLEVKEQPAKTTYTEGDKFDATGLVLEATYSNGEKRDITSGYTWEPAGALTTADTKVTVSYETEKVEIAITVNAAEASVTSIKVTALPYRMFYNESEAFDATGMVVSAVYDDGSMRALDSTDYAVETTAFTAENKTLKITSGEFITELNVHIRRTTNLTEEDMVVAKEIKYTEAGAYTLGNDGTGTKNASVGAARYFLDETEARRLRCNSNAGAYVQFAYTFEGEADLANAGFMTYGLITRTGTVVKVSTDGENWMTIAKTNATDSKIPAHWSEKADNIVGTKGGTNTDGNMYAMYFSLADYIGEAKTVYVRFCYEAPTSAGTDKEGADIFGSITFYSKLNLEA